MPNSERIASLIIRSIRGKIDSTEQAELDAWMAESETNRKTAESFLDPEKRDQGIRDHWVEEKIWARLDKAIPEETGYTAVVRRRWIKWVAAAAAAVIAISGTYLFLNNHRSSVEEKQVVALVHDVSPGSNKAVLTLANGSKIILDSAHNGILAKQSGSTVTKTDSGQLAYTIDKSRTSEKSDLIEENILSTPRGGQYQLVLPDGTKVWLNAASSIVYPTAFVGKERKVSISGEVYFEVAHNASKPFFVSVNKMDVEVLGTHFNINAYTDESSMNTTLLEGSVKVTYNNQAKLLKPGQQSQVAGKSINIEENADLDYVMAWRNGEMELAHGDVKKLFREISRWYDVDVEYRGVVPEGQFAASIKRNLPLSNLLNVLNAYGVHTQVLNKKIVVQ